MADGDEIPGVSVISIIDLALVLLLFIFLFSIPHSCWLLGKWWLNLARIATVLLTTLGMLKGFSGSHLILVSYFVMKLVMILGLAVSVIATWKVGTGNWVELKDCLRESELCRDQVSAAVIGNPIFIACCKGPASCNSHPSNNSSSIDPNCRLWSSTNLKTFCYECQSCKDAVLGEFMSRRKPLAILCTTYLGIFLLLYIAQLISYWKSRKHISTRVTPSNV